MKTHCIATFDLENHKNQVIIGGQHCNTMTKKRYTAHLKSKQLLLYAFTLTLTARGPSLCVRI